MKQLFINNTATTMFFRNENSIEQIAKWVQSRLNDLTCNPFNLNEPYSAKITDIDEDSVLIVGDEDYMELLFEEVKPIDVTNIY